MAGLLGANSAQSITNQILSSLGGGIGNLSNVQFAPNLNFINGPVPQTQISGFGIPNLSLPSFASPSAGAFASAGAGSGFGLGLGSGAGAGTVSVPNAANYLASPVYFPQYFPVGGGADASAQAQAQAGGGQDLGSILALLSLLGGDSLGGNGGGSNAYAGGGFQQPPPYYQGGYYPPPPLAPPPPPPTVTTTAGGGPTATVMGDPHFTGFEGDKYDVQGTPNGIYNLISDKNVQYNAKFVGDDKVTMLGEAGLKIGSGQNQTKIQMKAGANETPSLNGKAMEKNKQYTFDTGLTIKDDKGQTVRVQGSAKWDGTNLVVNTGEYEVKLMNKGGNLDQDTKITNIGVMADGVKSHGLLGQTADFDGKVRNGKTGVGAQGEGAIDGNVNDYKVNDLFDDNFKYNKFGAQTDVQAKYGVGAGKGGTAN